MRQTFNDAIATEKTFVENLSLLLCERQIGTWAVTIEANKLFILLTYNKFSVDFPFHFENCDHGSTDFECSSWRLIFGELAAFCHFVQLGDDYCWCGDFDCNIIHHCSVWKVFERERVGVPIAVNLVLDDHGVTKSLDAIFDLMLISSQSHFAVESPSHCTIFTTICP